MVKTSFKQKFIQAFFFGCTYAMLMGIFEKSSTGEFNTIKFLIYGMVFGILMGFVLPLVTHYFSKRSMDKIILETHSDEQIKLESYANHNGGLGKIVLTNQRLLFKEKGTSEHNFIEIHINQIIEVDKKKSLGFINNIFVVKTASKNYDFIVYENERDAWVLSTNNLRN